MSQPVLLKVYGNLCPCRPELAARLAAISGVAIPAQDVTKLEGDLLTISFEGIFFPVDETVAEMARSLKPGQAGKLDVLDLEAWRLERFQFADGKMSQAGAPLNNVLAYSGH